MIIFVKFAVVIAYIMLMIAMGYWCMKKTKNVGDFYIGGRTLGPWISALAYGTTYFSAVLFVGFAGKLGWGFGLNALWIAAGNALIGVLFAWWLLAGRTRDMTARLDAITMPEFLSARYGVKWFKPVAALVVFIFLVPYSASVYQGLGHLFAVNLHMGYLPAIITMATITGVYLIMGGYLALAITDMVRGVMEFTGAFLLVFFVAHACGYNVLETFATSSGAGFAPALAPPPPTGPAPMFSGLVTLICLVFMTSVGPMGLPQMTQKFYSLRDRSIIPKAMLIATIFCMLMAFSAYYTGAMSHHFFNPPPKPGAVAQAVPAAAPALVGATEHQKLDFPLNEKTGKPDFDLVVPTMVTEFMPEWFAVVVLLLILAASMSSLSSLVLVSAATVTVDLVGARDISDKSTRQGLLLLRVMCGVFVAVSVLMAAYRLDAIITLMSMSWGSLAGAFIGPYVWGLFSKRVTPAAGVTGFLAGLCTMVVLFIVWGPTNAPVAATAAMIVSLVSVPVVSMFTPRISKEIVAKAFGE